MMCAAMPFCVRCLYYSVLATCHVLVKHSAWLCKQSNFLLVVYLSTPDMTPGWLMISVTKKHFYYKATFLSVLGQVLCQYAT